MQTYLDEGTVILSVGECGSQRSKLWRASGYVAESVVCENTFLDYDERSATSRVR